MATSGLSYDNRSSPSGFGNGTVINDNSSILWINYYIYVCELFFCNLVN